MDLSNGDVEWRDTTVTVDESNYRIEFIGTGRFTIGPGTHIIMNVPEVGPTYLFNRDTVWVAGEEDNPVVFEFNQANGSVYQPFEPAQVTAVRLEHVQIRGGNLELDLPYELRNCQVEADRARITSTSPNFFIEDCRFRGEMDFVTTIFSFRRSILEGVITTPRIMFGENSVFASRPGFSSDTTAIILTTLLTARLDHLNNVYFHGDYTTLVQTNAHVDISYSGWSTTRSNTELFTGDVELGEGILDGTDARFWNAERGDYHLQWDSPLIDAGDPELPNDPDGTRSDIGVYPYDPNGIEPCTETIQPLAFGIESLYPNPFNGMTTLSLSLPRTVMVDVVVYDMLGRQVGVLHHGVLHAGQSPLSADLSDHPSGLYFIVAQAGSQRAVAKAMLVK